MGCRDRQSNSNGGPVCAGGGDGLFWFGHLEAAEFVRAGHKWFRFLRWTWNNRNANAVMATGFGRDADGHCEAIAPTRFLGFITATRRSRLFLLPAAAWLNGPTASAGLSGRIETAGAENGNNPRELLRLVWLRLRTDRR
jgi:hypothetical protein